MPIPSLTPQIRIPRAALPLFPPQTRPRNLDIHPNILNQALHTHIIIFRPDEAQDADRHLAAVEVPPEVVQHVHLGAAHAILVEGVIADRHHHRVDAVAFCCFGGGEGG